MKSNCFVTHESSDICDKKAYSTRTHMYTGVSKRERESGEEMWNDENGEIAAENHLLFITPVHIVRFGGGNLPCLLFALFHFTVGVASST